jgi:hypothetical protein
MEQDFIPHVKYIATDDVNVKYIYKEYIGNNNSLTNGKIYEFHQVLFSPDKETKRRRIWVTKSDNDVYIRYEDNARDWKTINNPNQ